MCGSVSLAAFMTAARLSDLARGSVGLAVTIADVVCDVLRSMISVVTGTAVGVSAMAVANSVGLPRECVPQMLSSSDAVLADTIVMGTESELRGFPMRCSIEFSVVSAS
jgi:hypothetical protein